MLFNFHYILLILFCLSTCSLSSQIFIFPFTEKQLDSLAISYYDSTKNLDDSLNFLINLYESNPATAIGYSSLMSNIQKGGNGEYSNILFSNSKDKWLPRDLSSSPIELKITDKIRLSSIDKWNFKYPSYSIATSVEKRFVNFIFNEKSNYKVYSSVSSRLKELDNELFLLERALPRFSPSPPPQPSTRYTISRNINKEEIHDVLLEALSDKGYNERFYYRLDDGVVILTQLENIDENKKTIKDNRWGKSGMNHSTEDFNFTDFFKTLLFPITNNSRVFMFWITTEELKFSNDSEKLLKSDIINLENKAVAALPPTYSFVSSLPSESYSCYVLVYEFLKKEYEDDAQLVEKTISAKEHLIKTGLMIFFEKYGW